MTEEAFHGDWCHWHHRPEPLRPGDFKLCFECGHVWRTREEFEADVRRESAAAGVEPDLDQPFLPALHPRLLAWDERVSGRHWPWLACACYPLVDT